MSDKRIVYNTQRRLLEIDRYIASGAYPTASYLAKKFECSTRTILRDIYEMKLFYHAPIAVREGTGGYYYKDSTFFLKSVMLSEGELFSIALFDQLLKQYENTPLEENLRRTFEKITAGLPDSVTVDSSFLKGNVTFIPDLLPSIDTTVFETIFTGLQNHKTLTFDYRPLQKNTFMERKLDPYHAVCQKGNWYVIGYCHKAEAVRIYSLSRMKKLSCTKKTFTVPSDFDIRNHVDPNFGVWNNPTKPVKVELLFSKEISTYILERSWHEGQKMKQYKDGSVYLSFKSNQMQESLFWILHFGSAVKVLNPPELVEKVKKEVKKILKQY